MRFSHWRDLPCFGSGSHQLAEHAFKDEIIGVEIKDADGFWAGSYYGVMAFGVMFAVVDVWSVTV